MPATMSPPTCIEVPNAPTGARDQIWVVDNNGNLVGFNAFHFQGANLSAIPHDLPIVNPPSAMSAGPFPASEGPGPYAPTYSGGLLFVSAASNSGGNPSGGIWIANPAAGTALESPSSQGGASAGC